MSSVVFVKSLTSWASSTDSSKWYELRNNGGIEMLAWCHQHEQQNEKKNTFSYDVLIWMKMHLFFFQTLLSI